MIRALAIAAPRAAGLCVAILGAVVLGVGAAALPAYAQAPSPTQTPLGRELTLSLSGAKVPQGDVLIARVRAAPDSLLVGALGDIAVNFAPDPARGPGNFIALIGIDGMAQPGALDLVVIDSRKQADDPDNCDNLSAVKRSVTIMPRNYAFERVKLSAALGYTLDPKTSTAEQRIFDDLYSGFSPDKRWSGPFLLPSGGRQVAGYGARRAYNGVNLGTYHTGVDLSSVSGTPVRASASGTVVNVQEYPIRGLAVVVDHGRGVFTSYFHLSKALVKQGETVKAGQRLGNVGTTGRSQGNHVHWELAVGGAPVEPLFWTKVALP